MLPMLETGVGCADVGLMQRLNRLLFERGILKAVQKLYGPAAHTDEDIQRTLEAIRDTAEHTLSD